LVWENHDAHGKVPVACLLHDLCTKELSHKTILFIHPVFSALFFLFRLPNAKIAQPIPRAAEDSITDPL
jgi:hypothetical protein